MDACLTEELVVDLLDGSLPPEAVTAVHAHADGCAPCRALLADALPPGENEPVPVRAGATLDRYLLTEAIGAGASGVVFAAFDPKLGRKVAIKLLRADAREAGELRARLKREATALAQLQHPNVVAVHDSGEVPEGVFLALELVEGSTLADWLRQGPRSPRAILDLFLQAGEGLRAAHQAGLVHRDFKPDNVLVGDDGRVRVTDFGLARAAGELGPPPSGSSPTTLVTQSGALIGTPAFMAPEQLRGERADARSDQFGFCVALYEALYGSRPFAGKDLAELQAAIARDEPVVPRRRGLSRRLRAALRRGLRADPEARFDDLGDLLRELRPAPGARWPFLASGAAVAALAAALSLRGFSNAPCRGAEAAWGEVWSPAQQASARAALARADAASAGRLFAAADGALGRYRAAWTALHEEACRATRVRGEQSEALLDRRMQCLSERRAAADAIARVLAEGNNAGALAASAVSALPPLDLCSNAGALNAKVPPDSDPGRRAVAEQLSARLALADVLSNSGRMDQSLEMAAQIGREAEAIGNPSLLSRALRLQAFSSYKPASEREAMLTRAAAAGIEARDDEAAVDAWTRLVYELGVVQLRTRDGYNYATVARAALGRLGQDHARIGILSVFEADLAFAQRDEARARALLEEARVHYVAVGGPSFWRLGVIEERLGNWDLQGCRADLALAHHEASQRFRENAGPRAATKVTALTNQAEDLLRLGRPEEAKARLDEAAELARQREPGRNWYLHADQAWVLRALRRPAEALALDEDARAVCEQFEGRDAAACAWPLRGLGLDLLALGRAKEAVAPLTRSLQLAEVGPDLLERMETRFAYARALRDSGVDPAGAQVAGRKARDEVAAMAARHAGFCVAMQAEIDRWLAAGESAARR